jgi:hypothetical protein
MREGSKSRSVATPGLAGAQNVAQIVNAGFSEFGDQFDDAIAFDAFLRAEETLGKVFDGVSGKLLQDVDQILGHAIGVDGFFDHLGQSIFDADAGAEILDQGRPLLGYPFERVAEFGDGFVLFAGTGLLPEAREGGAQQALDFGIAFIRQVVADHGQGIGHDFIGSEGVEIRELSHADGSLAAGFGIFGVEAAAVVGENFRGDLIVVALIKDFDELANIARRHAGGFAGEQNAFFAGFGNLSPEHAVENVGVGIDEDAGLG